MSIVESAWKLQRRLEKKGFHIRQVILEELKKYKFKESDKTLFFLIAVFCMSVSTFMLFFDPTDYFIVPMGVGLVSLLFFLLL